MRVDPDDRGSCCIFEAAVQNLGAILRITCVSASSWTIARLPRPELHEGQGIMLHFEGAVQNLGALSAFFLVDYFALSDSVF